MQTERWIMHIDMDAFFASVEQYRNHPHLAGKPLCVGHDPKKGKGRGVVRAVSYEARAHGIHSGMPVSQAYRLCPDAAFVSGEFSSYLEASDEFMELLHEFADGRQVRRASIDEAYIEVTLGVREYPTPHDMAVEIQEAVKVTTKLPCSFGVASNMAVAKVATGMNKPRGITVVGQDEQEIMQFLAPLSPDALNGVGKKTAERLNRHGIHTLSQIQQMSVADLWPMMGRGSSWLHKRACGIDDRPLIGNGPRIRKSISKERTFMEDVQPTDVTLIHHTIAKICSRIAKRLRDKALKYRTVTVKMRYSDYTTLQRSRTVPVADDDRAHLYKTALDIFDQKRDKDKSIRLVGVKVSNLAEQQAQSSLVDYF
ncbi:MAG: DNA polymerase IV [Candidatus Thorarchaeota archaeon]|jgi:nucleotidyltransferase/DNA polymerase involved in DNA repair